MPSRSLPQNPSLELDKKRAKRLLARVRDSDPEALERLRTHHPRFADSSALVIAAAAKLHDAQLVIAREYGFASWPRLHAFVRTRCLSTAARAARLVQAACSGDIRSARLLLETEPELARHDVWTACACGEPDLLADLLARQPELARRPGGPDARQPLLAACHSRFLRADAERARRIVECVRILLAHGADPNAHYFVTSEGHRKIQTCLYGAAGVANNAEITRMLLEAGADVNEFAPPPEPGKLSGMEALYHASEFHDVACLEHLLAAKPYPLCISYCFGRALDFDNERAALLYLAYGADANTRIPWFSNRSHLHKAAIKARTPATIAAMLERGADPDAVDARGVSAYRYAVRYGHTELVKVFEARGADRASVTDEDRWSAQLATAARSSGRVDSKFAPDPDLIELAIKRGRPDLLRALLEAGADLSKGSEMQPLHTAAYFGCAEAVALLIEAGADLRERNPFGGTALGAAAFGSEHCVDPEGGVGNLLPEEIKHGDYARVAKLLIEAGIELPTHIAGGSDAFANVLRRSGVRDREE